MCLISGIHLSDTEVWEVPESMEKQRRTRLESMYERGRRRSYSSSPEVSAIVSLMRRSFLTDLAIAGKRNQGDVWTYCDIRIIIRIDRQFIFIGISILL